MKKKLFVFDIDRTIKPWFSDIPAPTLKAIQLLKEKHIIALATGRCYNECKHIIDLLDIKYLVCNGGSDVYIDKKMVYQNVPDFSKELELLEAKKPIHFFACDHGVYSYHYPKFMKSIGFFKYFYPKISSIYGLIAMMGNVKEVSDDMGCVHKFYVFGKYSGTLPYNSIGNFVHTYEYENKALGIQYLMKELAMDELIAFGDSRNDITMFDIADRCYANIKGNKDLKQKATGLFSIKNGIYEIVLKELEDE